MSKEKFLRFYEGTPFYENAKLAYEAVEKAFLEIPCASCGSLPVNVSPLVMAIALGTIRIECSRSYLPMIENLNYSAKRLLEIFPKYFNTITAYQYANQPERIANRVYANRMGNRDEASGDGWKNRGAGWLMWTGEENQKRYGINPNNYQDINQNAKALAQYFVDRGIISLAVSLKDYTIGSVAWVNTLKAIRIKVNGGLNGYTEFETVIRQFLT
jgi:putative chitinase